MSKYESVQSNSNYLGICPSILMDRLQKETTRYTIWYPPGMSTRVNAVPPKPTFVPKNTHSERSDGRHTRDINSLATTLSSFEETAAKVSQSLNAVLDLTLELKRDSVKSDWYITKIHSELRRVNAWAEHIASLLDVNCYSLSREEDTDINNLDQLFRDCLGVTMNLTHLLPVVTRILSDQRDAHKSGVASLKALSLAVNTFRLDVSDGQETHDTIETAEEPKRQIARPNGLLLI